MRERLARSVMVFAMRSVLVECHMQPPSCTLRRRGGKSNHLVALNRRPLPVEKCRLDPHAAAGPWTMISAILLAGSRVMRKLWVLSLLLAAAASGAAPSRCRDRPSRGHRRRFIRDRRHAHQVERGPTHPRVGRPAYATARFGHAATRPPRSCARSSRAARSSARARTRTRTAAWSRCAAAGPRISARKWCPPAWRSRTANTATTTSPRKTGACRPPGTLGRRVHPAVGVSSQPARRIE